MIFAAIHDQAGRIDRTLGASRLEDLNALTAGIFLPDGWSCRYAPALLLATETWWNGTAWDSRPAPPPPPALTPDTLVMWTGLPPGCTVTVVDPITGIMPEGGSSVISPTGALSFMLPAGPWRLEVSEKFPFKAAVFEVEV